VPCLFELPTSLLEYLNLLQGVAVPLSSELLHLYDCDYEIYNIATQPYYCWWTHSYCIETIAPHTPLTYLLSEKKTLCYQLCSTVMQQYKLTAVYFCNQSSHYENYGRFNGSHHVPTAKSTLFMVNKDEWYTKEGHGKCTKNTLYVQRLGKRHLSGWSDIEQQINQACNLSHCRVWRHQAGRQAVETSIK